MNISAGKWLGLRRLADESGLFKIVAVDQRPPIQNFIKSTFESDADINNDGVVNILDIVQLVNIILN